MAATEAPLEHQQSEPVLPDRDGQLIQGGAVATQELQELEPRVVLAALETVEQASGGEVHRFLLSDLRVVRYHRPPSAGASAQRLPLQATTDNEYSHTCFQS